MKRRFLYFLLICSLVFALSSCHEDSPEPVTESTRTVFVYMPWSTDLLSAFEQNLEDLKTAISEMGGLKDERLIVFLSSSTTSASLFEITYQNGTCSQKQIKQYTNPSNVSLSGLTQLLTEVRTYAPAKSYSMIIGCHGMGWVPVYATDTKTTTDTKTLLSSPTGTPRYLTRWFGAYGNKACQTEISTLRQAMELADFHTDYLLFDDCYMSNIEVAYELKDVTSYLIASPCEIMASGMPYKKIGKYLFGTPDYGKICEEFHTFYSTYAIPCGTLAVTDCSQLDQLADVVRTIHSRYTFDETYRKDIQVMDGYSPALFFDFADYFGKFNLDADLQEQLATALADAVPYKVNTPYTYSQLKNGFITLRTYSGLTISEPSINPSAAKYKQTSWYITTH